MSSAHLVHILFKNNGNCHGVEVCVIDPPLPRLPSQGSYIFLGERERERERDDSPCAYCRLLSSLVAHKDRKSVV